MREFRIAIVGGGATGVALARALALRGETGVVLLEKERGVARHTSGRNSGVLHVGYNQKPGSLKARLCVEGNRRIKEFCRARKVPLVEGGILIVARAPAEVPRLAELLGRGEANGVEGLRLVDRGDIAAIEPEVVGAAALHAPSGASVDAAAYVAAMAAEAVERGVEVRLAARLDEVAVVPGGYEIGAGGERLRAARLVNCAGLHADRLAHRLDAGREYGIVPIRGEYRRLRPERFGLVRSMVYPVPDLEFPFLGVHWTKTAHGEVKIGPNAVPALGREAYAWGESTLTGALALAADARAWRLLFSPGFPGLLAAQLRNSLSRERFAAEARALVPALRTADLAPGPGPAGIRAQVVDRRGRMVDDLLVEEAGSALHVLNVVSPGLTCSMALADELVKRLR